MLLTTGADNPNAANAVFLLDDAEPGALDDLDRCLVLFDGRDQAALAAARRRWTELKGRDLSVSYWRESAEGRWEKQA